MGGGGVVREGLTYIKVSCTCDCIKQILGTRILKIDKTEP